MDSLLFGTAGKPISTKGDTVEGIKHVRRLGLDCMELEFVHSINITKEKAILVNKAAKEKKIILTCHAPFYININSIDKKKFHASLNYIINSAKITSLCNGWSVCFHAGFYQKDTKEKTYETVKEGMKKIIDEVKNFDKKIWIRPEISGKISQFGSLNEIIRLSQELEQVMPCVDFAHMFARTNGKYNTKPEFISILEEIEKGLGKEALNNMHIHISGIEYGEKGERNHLILEHSKLDYKELLNVLKEYKVKGVVICESPNIEEDAMLMQNLYKKF